MNLTEIHPLTVGKVESGSAVVITDDLQMLELPASLLPPNSSTGSIVRVHVEDAPELRILRHADLCAIQEVLLCDFGTAPEPATIQAGLRLIEHSHTTITLEWTLPAGTRSIVGYLNGRRLPNTQSRDETRIRLTGLELATNYSFKIIFQTTSGRYSAELSVNTAAIDDFSCLKVAIDALPDEVVTTLKSLGVQITEEPTSSNIIVTGRNHIDEESGVFKVARESNVPVVTREWVDACKNAGRMLSVSQFYCQ